MLGPEFSVRSREGDKYSVRGIDEAVHTAVGVLGRDNGKGHVAIFYGGKLVYSKKGADIVNNDGFRADMIRNRLNGLVLKPAKKPRHWALP